MAESFFLLSRSSNGPMVLTHPFFGLSEPFCSLSHFLGAVICLLLTLPIWRSAKGHFGHRIAIGVFCFSSVLLLTTSGVYHLLPPDTLGKAVFQKLDHAAIFILIAGTFTPMHSILFRGVRRWLPLALIWSIAAAGITIKTIYFAQVTETLSLGVYLGMGWLGIISGFLIYSQSGFSLIGPLLSGALSYTFGCFMEFTKSPVILPGIIASHELFHVAVLIGIAYHWKFVRAVALQSDFRVTSKASCCN